VPTGTARSIPLENLLLNQHNPRHASQTSQRDAIFALTRYKTDANKLVNLAEDIADRGLNPSEVILVRTITQECTRYWRAIGEWQQLS
jgi:hypothetical protein